MCKNQTSVSHSSTASEIISLDAGLRKDGLPALDLRDVVIEVLHSTNNTERPIRLAPGNWCGTRSHSSNKTKTKTLNCQMWTTYPQTHILLKASLSCASLKTTKQVIKMIIKGRSPTMRHVSRTHRVALDWLFDRINLEPKIQIKYVDTKNQLADLGRSGESASSASTRKLERGDDIQIGRTRLEFHNMLSIP